MFIRINSLKEAYEEAKNGSNAKKNAEELFAKASKIDGNEEFKLLQIQELLKEYEQDILRNTLRESQKHKDFNYAEDMIQNVFRTLKSYLTTDNKSFLQSLQKSINSISNSKLRLSETELINLKNIYTQSRTYLISLMTENKLSDETFKAFALQFCDKIIASLKNSSDREIYVISNILISLKQEISRVPNQSKDKVSEEYVYTGYPKNASINMSSNGIGISLQNGKLRYTKVPQNASIHMTNGQTKYFVNGRQVFPISISEEEAIALGAKKPNIGDNGSVNIGGVSMNSGSVNIGNNFSFDDESEQENVQEGGKISGGIHTIDVSKIKNLDKISGGVVSISGNGMISLDKISGGVINIQNGVTVKLDKISGGVINIGIGAKVSADKISGGVINGASRITYDRKTGGIIN